MWRCLGRSLINLVQAKKLAASLSVDTLSQGGLMNLLRCARVSFQPGREAAVATLRRAAVVASDETGVRIEGSNAFHWVFHSAEAGVHTASRTRGAVAAREMIDGHRPAVWISDRYTAQHGCCVQPSSSVR